MQRLLDNELFAVEHDAARQLVFMRRKGVRISEADWDAEKAKVLAVLRPLRGQRLLIDARSTPGNNAPSVEQRVNQFRRQLAVLFPVCVALVATAVGRLQVLRMGRERGEQEAQVFLDEAAAIAYLMSQELTPPARRLPIV